RIALLPQAPWPGRRLGGGVSRAAGRCHLGGEGAGLAAGRQTGRGGGATCVDHAQAPGRHSTGVPRNALGTMMMFENIRADLRTYEGRWGAQGLWVMLVYRYGRWRYGVRPTPLRKFFSLIYHVLYKLVQIVTGIELPCEAVVGSNFVIDHFG